LLGTPGGRERFRRLQERASVSPTTSPSKSRNPRATGALGLRSANVNLGDALGEAEEDEDEDEEVLELRLQEIQAKLKLKKLKAAKENAAIRKDGAQSLSARPDSAPLSRRSESRTGGQIPDAIPRPRYQATVEVPASPVRKAQPMDLAQRSPSRVLLGIDKGLRAKDVSLKRASSLRNAGRGRDEDVFGGPLVKDTTTNGLKSIEASDGQRRPLSFNERLASAKTEEVARQERQQKIRQLRSTAFEVGRQQMEDYKTKAVDTTDYAAHSGTYSRDEILGSNQPATTGLKRSSTAPLIRPKQDGSNPEDSSYDPYSTFFLSRRILPHSVVHRSLKDKKCYKLQDLLPKVTSPSYCLPDIESDVVVLAIIASKSDPRDHKPAKDADGQVKEGLQRSRGKYMVLTLTDLTYDLELFLFRSAFDRYWKLPTGTAVAILNPTILPPPKGARQAAGRWALSLNSDTDAVIELGVARDLGYCASVRRDGSLCSAWVNAKKTAHCEFHTNEALSKARHARMEVNAGFGAGAGGAGRRRFNSREVSGVSARDAEKAKRDGEWDRQAHTRFFATRSAAVLLDGEAAQFATAAERREATKRRLAAREKEAAIAKSLSAVGSGAGREYAAAAAAHSDVSTATPSSSSSAAPQLPTARSLGLLPSSAAAVRLSPAAKRKRPDSSHSSLASGGGGGGLGWGSSLKDKLARMREGEKVGPRVGTTGVTAAGRTSPVRKKTRFVTEKGIREAGRESLGAELAAGGAAEDDDDELVIV
jgi:minichromosome maintenance protein 10